MRGICIFLFFILFFGLLSLYSVDRTEGHILFKKQILWIAIGISGMILLWRTDYRRFSTLSLPLYFLSIVLLLSPFFLPPIKGVHRWITWKELSIQPSEFAKLTFCMLMAKVFSRIHQPSLKYIFIPILPFLPPFLLILKGPDFGTAFIFFCIFMLLLYIWGTKFFDWLTLCFCALSIPISFLILYKLEEVGIKVSLLPFIFCSILFGVFYSVTKGRMHIICAFLMRFLLCFILCAYFYNTLHLYQKMRIKSFFEEHHFHKDYAYSAIQSKIAIGSGYFLGKGWMRGTQGQRGFLPAAYSDFIFSHLAEEWGFVGTTIFLLLYAGFLKKIFHVAFSAPDIFSFFLCIGLSFNIALQAIINIFMALGILPVVGLPLPFVSYGGSNIVCSLLSIGIILSIARRSGYY